MPHFKLEVEIALNCRFEADEEIEFRYTSPAPVVVRLRQLVRNYEAHFARTGNAICTATTIKDIEPEIKAGLEDSCLEDRYVQISKLKPDTLKTINEIFCPLRSISRSTIVMLNWRHGLDSPPNPYRSLAFYSEDGNRWLQFARATTGSFNFEEASRIIYAKDIRVDEVVRKVELGFEEPLGRQLFREAWDQIGINPRGALVIGVAAAEVGLKRLIGTLIPAAEWLVQEVQAPPMRKILRDFLPTLPVRATWADGSPIKLPAKVISEVVKASELRNKVVHVGALPPSREELAIMLGSISDLLWMCDVLSGEHWAMKHVSKKNWPAEEQLSLK
jgi:hypothetical protein